MLYSAKKHFRQKRPMMVIEISRDSGGEFLSHTIIITYDNEYMKNPLI